MYLQQLNKPWDGSVGTPTDRKNMNCLPKKFLNKQNEFRSVGTPTDREMLLVAKRNNITLRSEYASQNLVPSWPPVHNESVKRSKGEKKRYEQFAYSLQNGFGCTPLTIAWVPTGATQLRRGKRKAMMT
jgi:hypothetical protein